jgi:tetratricopeptide (TPR) repeat protein
LIVIEMRLFKPQNTEQIVQVFHHCLGRLCPRIGKTIALIWGSAWLFCSPVLAQTAVDYRQQGLAYRSQGLWNEAMATLERAVNLDPNNLSGRVLWGWTAHLAGQDHQAAAILTANLERDPFHIETLNALGIVYLVQGKVWPAIVTHSWAGMLKPDNEIAFYNLSLGFQRVGLLDWSIATAEYASVLDPYNPHPLVALALAHGTQAAEQATVEQDAVEKDAAEKVRTIVQATRRLDDRYSDLAFFDHLEEAGFSPEQITQTRILFQQY